MIYVGHPYKGLEENKRKVEGIIKSLSTMNPGTTFVSPIHTFGFMYDDFIYEVGLCMCLDLLSKCDMMYVCGDYENSRGCMAEIKYCEEHDIPHLIYDDEVGVFC
jgi:hypothetical protein